MKCPFCGFDNDKVIDSRNIKDGREIRRRRLCSKCSLRFTTYERYEAPAAYVVKSDGRREPYSREKVKTGLVIACKKRAVAVETINNIVLKIEEKIFCSASDEVSSKSIGEFVMKELYEVDQVAYVRFASVYKNFKDKEEFAEELSKIDSKNR